MVDAYIQALHLLFNIALAQHSPFGILLLLFALSSFGSYLFSAITSQDYSSLKVETLAI